MPTHRDVYALHHPVYLDNSMMMSFLAALDGGVSLSEDETSSTTGARDWKLSGKAGLRAKLFSFVDGELSSEGSTGHRDESSFISQTVRHHTAASLFNVLYDYLTADEFIVELIDTESLGRLTTGSLVQLRGEYLGNPLEDIVSFIDGVIPYVTTGAGTTPPKVTPPKVSTQAKNKPTEQTQAPESEGIKIMRLMATELRAAPVHDLLFRTAEGVSCVAAVSSEYYTQATAEHLRAGVFNVVGKVTRTLSETQQINLARRTAAGAAGAVIKNIVDEFRSMEGIALDVADPIVAGPALQVLPMAIFV